MLGSIDFTGSSQKLMSMSTMPSIFRFKIGFVGEGTRLFVYGFDDVHSCFDGVKD